MTPTIRVWDCVECPTLGQVEAYLRAHGWALMRGASQGWRLWSRAGWETSVPDAERIDWSRRARDTVEDLAEIEGRTARAVAMDILSTPITGDAP